MHRGPTDAGDDDVARLAALADGTLPPEDRAELERRVLASAELAGLLAEQRRALDLLHTAAAGVEASPALREAVGLPPRPAPRRRRPGRLPAISLAAIAAMVAVVAAVALLSSDTPASPTVVEAAELAAGRPSAGPPPPQPGTPELLRAGVDGVPFPSWKPKFAWQTVGRRVDRLHGREAVTVDYTKRGRQLAYTIVSGNALEWPKDAHTVTRHGVTVRVFTRNGHKVAAWLRHGRTCVLSDGPRASERLLVKLATWKGGGKVPF